MSGRRITDDGLSEEILKINGLDGEMSEKQLKLFQKDREAQADSATCPRIRSFVDLGQCGAPEAYMKWLQVDETVPAECRGPCTAAPAEIQGAHFVSEENKLAMYSTPRLAKPLSELIQAKALNIRAADPEASYESKDYNVVVSAHEPLDRFAETVTMLVKSMKQIGVDKKSLKQTIADC